MTSVRLQDVGKNPFARVREEPQRSDRISGDPVTVHFDAGSRSRNHRLTTGGEEALTCTPAACPHRIGEHGLASLAECGIRLLPLFRRNYYAGIIRLRLKQQVCDRV